MTRTKPRRLSIRTKLLILVLGMALPPLLIVSLLGLNSLDRARNAAVEAGSAALSEQTELNLSKRAADKARLYNATLNTIQQQAEGVATYTRTLIEAGPPPTAVHPEIFWIAPDGPTPAAQAQHRAALARAQQLAPLVQAVVERNPLVSLGYVALEDGGVLATDHDIVPALNGIKPFDPRIRSWYTAASGAGKTVWVDTYVDAVTKQLATTCATPVYDQHGTLIGVVGFDLLLGTIQQDLLQIDEGRGGYAFLMNDKGEVLVRPDMRAEGAPWNEPFESEDLATSSDQRVRDTIVQMIAGDAGIARLFFQGGDVYLAYAPIETAGWSVGIVVPEAQVVGPAIQAGNLIAARQRELRNQVLVLLAVALALIVAAAALLAVRLAQPLLQLQGGAQRIASGDLSHRLPQHLQDEIGDVMRSFNVMADSLRVTIAELEDNLRQLAMLNEDSNRFRSILSFSQLLDAIPAGVCRTLGFDRAALYLLDNQTLRAVSASFGPGREQQARQFLATANAVPIRIDGSTVEADILRTRQAVIVDNPWEHPRVLQSKQAVSRSDSYVQVPIFGQEGQIVGLISADYNQSQRQVSGRDASQLLTYANMAGLSIEYTQLYNELERQVAERTTALREALDRAQEADRLKSQFLASISHELRTPLNAIIGFSTVMLDELDGPISALQREDLKTINRNGRFLLHIINELLDLARIEAGRLEMQFQPIDIHELLEEVAETVQGLLYNKLVELRLQVPNKLPLVRGDINKIRQILLNLLANAVKFTHQGAITITAQPVTMTHPQPEPLDDQLTIMRNGQLIMPYLAISVRDTGIGIAAEHLPLVFEEFRQVHAGRTGKRGSGLGLAICRRLVEAHHGRIWVESVLDHGSVFTFTLPCYREPQSGQPEHNGAKQPSAGRKSPSQQAMANGGEITPPDNQIEMEKQ